MNPKTLINGVLYSLPLWAIIIAGGLYHHNQTKIEAKAELRNRKITDVVPQDWATILHTQADINTTRQALNQLVFGLPTLPTGSADVEPTPNGFTVHQPLGINSNVEYHKKSSNCLVMYHVGHANPGDKAMPPDIFGECSLLVFDMPLLGRNPQPTVSNIQGTYKLTSHDMMDTLALPVHPLYFFMNPINQVLNKVLAETPYKKVIMVGHSGGGWSTTLYAALDKRISLSIPVAGSLPIFLLATPPVAGPGDSEQHNADLLKIVSYQSLYVMATDGGRKQVQMLSRLDDQAFAGEASAVYAEPVENAAAQVGGQFEQYIDPASRHHEISLPMQALIKKILQN